MCKYTNSIQPNYQYKLYLTDGKDKKILPSHFLVTGELRKKNIGLWLTWLHFADVNMFLVFILIAPRYIVADSNKFVYLSIFQRIL